MGPRFLDAMAEHLPDEGDVLDIGCGYGLSALYHAGRNPRRRIHGFDLDQGRVETAAAVARDLGLDNARFAYGDAAKLDLERKFAAAYAIDLIHHIPRDDVPGFLVRIRERLQPGGRFVIKDVDSRPFYKRWVSWITDRVMVGFEEPIYYWPVEELRGALVEAGFRVQVHPMPDLLPYPHVLYVCET